MPDPLHIGMLLYPRLTQLDLTGPFEVFALLANTRVHLLWKTREPVESATGMSILPTLTLEECPALDVLFVPGGPGQVELMDDEAALEFLARQGAQARYVTSVCTGSLLLAAAGLLNGYRAACHWMARDDLALLGAIFVAERVVLDRNRITGAGVTAGIDFALTLAAFLRGETQAKAIQLALEYDPAPPFQSGSPERAGPGLVAVLLKHREPLCVARRAATLRAQARLESRGQRGP
ncbi:MAG: DJ-1/PfpI family protein [Bryobacteraceae bacterium]